MRKRIAIMEHDVREYFRRRGICFDEVYLDLQVLKQRAIYFMGVEVYIILSGSCNFPKRVVSDFAKLMQERVGVGVEKVVVLSDTELMLDEYYRYEGDFGSIKLIRKGKEMRGDKKLEEVMGVSGGVMEVIDGEDKYEELQGKYRERCQKMLPYRDLVERKVDGNE